MYGTLEVTTGPMFGGKTTDTLKQYLWEKEGQKRQVLALKPQFDTRYAEREIVSHVGLRADALSIDRFPWDALDPSIFKIFIDEAHFLEAPRYHGDLADDIRRVLAKGQHVHVAGLDLDTEGKPFRVMSDILAMADRVTKVRAECSCCRRDATKTQRIVAGGSRIELGTATMYEPRCNEHWSPVILAD